MKRRTRVLGWLYLTGWACWTGCLAYASLTQGLHYADWPPILLAGPFTPCLLMLIVWASLLRGRRWAWWYLVLGNAVAAVALPAVIIHMGHGSVAAALVVTVLPFVLLLADHPGTWQRTTSVKVTP